MRPFDRMKTLMGKFFARERGEAGARNAPVPAGPRKDPNAGVRACLPASRSKPRGHDQSRDGATDKARSEGKFGLYTEVRLTPLDDRKPLSFGGRGTETGRYICLGLIHFAFPG